MTASRIITVTLNPTIDRVYEVPGLAVGEHVCGRLRSRLPAGKAINVARTLASLHVPVIAMGFVGHDSAVFVASDMTLAGVRPQFTPIAGTDRENITLVDPIAPSETHIRDAGPVVSDAEVDALQEDLCRATAGDVVMAFTGSLAPGLSPERFGRLLDACIARGVAIAIDMDGESLRTASERPCQLIKPNLRELAHLVGHELSDDAAVVQAGCELARRIPLVLVTLGERGAYCFLEDEVWFAQAVVPAEQVRSTVGCGDATLGAFLAAWIMCSPATASATIEPALRQAVAVAAASALTDRPAFFDPGEARRLANLAEIRRIR